MWSSDSQRMTPGWKGLHWVTVGIQDGEGRPEQWAKWGPSWVGMYLCPWGWAHEVGCWSHVRKVEKYQGVFVHISVSSQYICGRSEWADIPNFLSPSKVINPFSAHYWQLTLLRLYQEFCNLRTKHAPFLLHCFRRRCPCSLTVFIILL